MTAPTAHPRPAPEGFTPGLLIGLISGFLASLIFFAMALSRYQGFNAVWATDYTQYLRITELASRAPFGGDGRPFLFEDVLFDTTYLRSHMSPILLVPGLIERFTGMGPAIATLWFRAMVMAIVPAVAVTLALGPSSRRAGAVPVPVVALGLATVAVLFQRATVEQMLGDIRPESLLFPFMLLAWAGLRSGRRWAFALGVLGLVTTKENGSLVALVFGVLALWGAPRGPAEQDASPPLGRAWGAVALLAGLVALGLFAALTLGTEGAHRNQSLYAAWRETGPDGASGLTVPRLLLKVRFTAEMAALWAFLPVFAPRRYWLLLLPWVAVFWPMDRAAGLGEFEHLAHYAASGHGAMAILALEGLAGLVARGRLKWLWPHLLATLLLPVVQHGAFVPVDRANGYEHLKPLQWLVAPTRFRAVDGVLPLEERGRLKAALGHVPPDLAAVALPGRLAMHRVGGGQVRPVERFPDMTPEGVARFNLFLFDAGDRWADGAAPLKALVEAHPCFKPLPGQLKGVTLFRRDEPCLP